MKVAFTEWDGRIGSLKQQIAYRLRFRNVAAGWTIERINNFGITVMSHFHYESGIPVVTYSNLKEALKHLAPLKTNKTTPLSNVWKDFSNAWKLC